MRDWRERLLDIQEAIEKIEAHRYGLDCSRRGFTGAERTG